MSISRRIFLKVGATAAVAAGIKLRPDRVVFGQDTDPLSNYTMGTFTQYLDSIFTIRGSTTVEVTLTKVKDTLPENASRAGGRESFVLVFRGGSQQLKQNTYTVEHPALGTFKLFLVPGDRDENGVQGYVASINRLAH